VAQLEGDKKRLALEVGRLQALLRVAHRAIGISPPAKPEEGKLRAGGKASQDQGRARVVVAFAGADGASAWARPRSAPAGPGDVVSRRGPPCRWAVTETPSRRQEGSPASLRLKAIGHPLGRPECRGRLRTLGIGSSDSITCRNRRCISSGWARAATARTPAAADSRKNQQAARAAARGHRARAELCGRAQAEVAESFRIAAVESVGQRVR
jgi:hypothetical protein